MGRALGEGLVTVHFYDLRSAQAALAEIREQHVRQQSLLGQQYGFQHRRILWWRAAGGRAGLIAGRAVWAQFAPEAAGLDGPNNGSLVVFNLDSDVSSAALKDVFEVFGTVKELRETPLKPRHRFVEFFDIRDAARALYELNGKEIFGKRVVIEFSRPGGQQARRCSLVASVFPSLSFCSPPNGRVHPANANTDNLWKRVQEGLKPPADAVAPRLLRLPRADASYGATSRPPLLGRVGGECSVSTNDKAAGDNARRGKRAGGSGPSSVPASSSRQHSGRHKNWKSQSGKSRSATEARFLFKDTFAGGSSPSSSFRDSRTTVMIKNIPNKYSQKLLLNMLDNHCIHYNERIAAEGDGSEPMSSYDFVYLPIDFNNKCNVGYGFVNMTSPEATWRLYKAFHLQPWEVFNSRKICHVTYARLQGLEALKEHFKNSKFACDTDEYMPVVFSPPRDGKTLSAPTPIGSRGGAALLTASGRKKMAELMEEMGVLPSDNQSMDGDGSLSPSTTGSTFPQYDQQVEDEEGIEDPVDGDDRDDDDNGSREASGGCGGGVGDMTELTKALRYHHL
ncbi:unnamed protein product [Spirodela intermedia]|uniref:RRM domain-containing protein n=1 Tax=Spirodela intermedia TaxID=51605 RepID=A0A7I8J1U6_SPIIN|nr:unnamed protein product [Spirodela intermedia]CAA6664128.1 unnamed protein product [Spirodela intermedia]